MTLKPKEGETMRKSLLGMLSLVALGCLVANAQQQPEEDLTKLLFGKKSKHDFGTVPRGPMISHTFKLRNRSDTPLQIMSVRHSSGAVKVNVPLGGMIKPKESQEVKVEIDTRRFSGEKNMAIFMSIVGKGIQGKAVLTVSANSQQEKAK